jgi:hypothetical protein
MSGEWHKVWAWVVSEWHRGLAWCVDHPAVTTSVTTFVVTLLGASLILWLLAYATARVVIRKVFNNMDAATIRETTAALQRSQAEAVNALRESNARAEAELREIARQLNEQAAGMVEHLRDGHLPIQLIASTPEERQTLEAMVSRASTPRVVYRNASSRKTKDKKARESLPTAWQHVLKDDDEEGDSCPMIKTEPPPPPPPESKPKRPIPKPKPGKNR